MIVFCKNVKNIACVNWEKLPFLYFSLGLFSCCILLLAPQYKLWHFLQCFCQNTFISYFFFSFVEFWKIFIHQIINPTNNYPLQCNSKKYLKNVWREISIYFQTTMCNQKIAPKKNKKRQFMSVDKNNNFLSRGKKKDQHQFIFHPTDLQLWYGHFRIIVCEKFYSLHLLYFAQTILS